MTRPCLYLSVDTEEDFLAAIEFGSVDDGQPDEAWEVVDGQLGFLNDLETDRCIGFYVEDFSEFDPDAPEVEDIWDEEAPHFDVPQLGLFNASAGEICLAVGPFLKGAPTLNRAYFSSAVEHGSVGRLVEAATDWQLCLESGDLMAHYGLGYTLLDLGDLYGAHRHLKAYSEISPHNAWAWCFLGKACAALGQTAEARAAFERAIELEGEGDQETDAPELLADLDDGGSRAPH